MNKRQFSIARHARWLVPVALISGALAFKSFVDSKVAIAEEAPPIPVRTMKPVRGDLVRTLALNAHVESESMVTVLPLVSGILQELYVEVGEPVRKDQVIARIDASRFTLQLQQAEAAYLSAKSSYERIGQLYRSGATTQQNYDQAKAQYDAYASQYELARLQLDYASVKSPVNGVILVKHLSVGSIAAPERPLVTIGDLGNLVVRAKIPERHYRAFTAARTTMPISIVGPAGDRYRGAIISIAPFVSAETKNFETVIAIEGGSEALRPGMFVELEFELERWDGALSLPFSALSGSTLWYLDGGVARSMQFTPAGQSGDDFLVPEEYADREFLVEGQYFVRDGSPVKSLNAADGGTTP